MKKILKKNQIIITALAIMIAVAGYLNFTKSDIGDTQQAEYMNYENNQAVLDELSQYNDSLYGMTEDELTKQAEIENNNTSQQTSDSENLYNIDATETMNDYEDTSNIDDIETENMFADISDEDIVAASSSAANVNDEDAGEAVLANNVIDSTFFSTAKLDREQVRSKNKEIFMEIINNTATSEQQKQDAINGIINITDIAEKEYAAETLLEAKGFGESIVNIVDENVDVVVNLATMTEQDVAQIQDIVMRKTGISAENIIISTANQKNNE